MWNSQMKKAAGLEYTGKQQGRKKAGFLAEIKERMIFMSKKIRLNATEDVKRIC